MGWARGAWRGQLVVRQLFIETSVRVVGRKNCRISSAKLLISSMIRATVSVNGFPNSCPLLETRSHATGKTGGCEIRQVHTGRRDESNPLPLARHARFG